jgi:SpoVK/Ycf46/Vps4 family AAA+-type ATPase
MTDRYRGPSVLLAATNHSGLLDQALWRRFDEVLTFRKPTVHEIRRLLRLRLRLKRVADTAVDVDRYASALKGLPHAAAEKLVNDARRLALLRDAKTVEPRDFDVALASVTARPW